MSFKTFDLAHDVASLVSSINEVVSVSSSLFMTASGDLNIKFYNNIATGSGQPALGGYWQTMFDSSPISPQATSLFDLTFGHTSGSTYNSPSASYGCANEKIKVYREMASVLLGDSNGVFSVNGNGKSECFFIMVKRGLMKDEIKKGTVNLILNNGARTTFVTATDAGAAAAFKQTVGGDYAPIFSGTTEVGLVYYNAGIIVIPASASGLPWTVDADYWSGSSNPNSFLTMTMASATIDQNVDGLRCHVDKIGFHNQTNLYSTVYFCRATNTEFNYSSNPTYVDDNKRIRVTSGSNVLQSRTYVTTVGLYDANDNLLAVGKTNKPITKSPDTEAIFRIRLDY